MPDERGLHQAGDLAYCYLPDAFALGAARGPTGKTGVAIRFCFGEDFGPNHWMPASEAEKLGRELLACAARARNHNPEAN